MNEGRGPLYPSPGSGQRRAWCRVLKTYLPCCPWAPACAAWRQLYIYIYVREPFLRLALWNQREPGSFLCLAHWKQSHSCVWLLGTNMNPGPFLCLALWNQNELGSQSVFRRFFRRVYFRLFGLFSIIWIISLTMSPTYLAYFAEDRGRGHYSGSDLHVSGFSSCRII